MGKMNFLEEELYTLRIYSTISRTFDKSSSSFSELGYLSSLDFNLYLKKFRVFE